MSVPKRDDRPVEDRATRYSSHSLVEVRRFKWVPILCDSAVLLDISTGGFKLEFTGEARVEPGSMHWLHIPLAPLGIYAPNRILCRSECRWFDEARCRMGGTLTDLSRKDQMVIEQIVTALQNRRSL